LSTKNKTKII